jgi:hypothetical protein
VAPELSSSAEALELELPELRLAVALPSREEPAASPKRGRREIAVEMLLRAAS